MKKFYLFLAVCFISIGYIHANQVENFWLDYSDTLINKEQAIQILYDSYDMPEGSTLLCTREVKDNTDMKHYTIQQYVNDIKVEGCYVLIHEKEGKVYSVNGRLLNVENTPQLQKVQNKKQIKAKLPDIDENDIEYLLFEHNGQFYFAYKYFDLNRYANVYVDSKSGEEIVAISTISSADVQGTAKTIYNGTQTITCNYTEGIYKLVDNARNIYTLNATQYDGENFNRLYNWVSATTSWNKPILSSITLEWASQDWWYNALTDTKPDFYIQISSGGSVLFTSPHFNDENLPVTFCIFPYIVEADGNLEIEVLDYDGVLDDSAGKVSITNTNAGIYSWNNSKTRASFTLINNPAHDAHWGMEKVYDFYLNKFNHKSYDNQGARIYQYVNPPSNIPPYSTSGFPNQASACYNNKKTDFWMAYGMGDCLTYKPFVMLDLMGHEFTHLVTAANGDQNLPNYGEGGALNESFGDIIGNAIEAFALGSTDWVFMKGRTYSNPNEYDRSMNSPKTDKSPFARPTTYKGEHWKPITGNPNNTPLANGGNDMDWVHINCSVQDYWFYLLCQGGFGYIDDKSVNGSYSVDGIGMDKAIQIVYRNLLYYITSTSKYSDSREGSIEAAIYLYGKGSAEHKAVVNAWHAVGVGDKYVEEPQDSDLTPGKYVIVANREEDSKNNWYYMTSDLGTASTKRFQAVSASTENIDAIATSNLDAQYIWELEADGSNWKLKNGDQYATWKSGNSANLDATGKSFTFDITDNQVVVHFNDGSAERYLSLHTGNDYFAFYGNTGQIEQLYFLPYEDKTTPPTPERECKSVPYTETFASSQGDFTVYNALLPSGFTSIWNWSSQYGMVAKCIIGSTKYASEAYLISPCIELPENSQCVLTFSHAAKFFQDTKQMSLWISTNYDETNPESADWDRLVIPTYPTGDNWNWFESGAIDLSSYSGKNVNIAFCYTSTESYAPQWEIKNFAVKQATTTVLDNIDIEKSTSTKILRNGQLIIMRDAVEYNVMGQEL